MPNTGVSILRLVTIVDGKTSVDFWVCGPTGGSVSASSSTVAGAIAGYFDQQVIRQVSEDEARAERGAGAPMMDAIVDVDREESDNTFHARVRLPMQPMLGLDLDSEMLPSGDLHELPEEAPTAGPFP